MSKRAKLQRISCGNVYSIRTKKGGHFALLVIVSVRGDGVLLGRLFCGVESLDFDKLKPQDCDMILKFGDLNIINSQWTKVGQITNFTRDEWGQRYFRRDPMFGNSVITEYDGDLKFLGQRVPSDTSELEGLPPEFLAGADSVEIHIDKYCKSRL